LQVRPDVWKQLTEKISDRATSVPLVIRLDEAIGSFVLRKITRLASNITQ